MPRDQLLVGNTYTLVQNTIYALPARACLCFVQTSGGTIQTSNDATTWTSVTLDTNNNFQSAAVFVKSISAASTITVRAFTELNIGSVGGVVPVSLGGTGLTSIAALSLWVANVLDTPIALTPGAGKSIRINAGGTAWEAYTPSSGGGTPGSPVNSVQLNIAGNFAGDANLIWGDLGGTGVPALKFNATSLFNGVSYGYIFTLPGQDYSEMDQFVYSDGFAGALWSTWMIAQSGDKFWDGSPLAPGDQLEIGWFGCEYPDTTTPSSAICYFRLAGNSVNAFITNLAGDMGLATDAATGNHPPTAMNSNVFVDGLTGNTNIKGTLASAGFLVGSHAGIDTTVTTGSLVGKTITIEKGIITGFA